MTLIQFFPTGSTVEYEIRPGVWVPCIIKKRTETVGRYICRYRPEPDGPVKDGVIDSHNLRAIDDPDGDEEDAKGL